MDFSLPIHTLLPHNFRSYRRLSRVLYLSIYTYIYILLWSTLLVTTISRYADVYQLQSTMYVSMNRNTIGSSIRRPLKRKINRAVDNFFVLFLFLYPTSLFSSFLRLLFLSFYFFLNSNLSYLHKLTLSF